MTDQEQPAEGGAGNASPHKRGAKFFEALLANSGDVLTLLDDKGHYIYHSPAIKEMIGVEPEEALGFFAADIVHSDDRDRVADRIRYCLANKGVRLSESFRLPHTDGSWRWVEADVRNLLDDPNIQGVLVVSRDVTSRRRLEDHFSIAENTAGFGTYRWDRDRNTRVVSSAFSQMLDLPTKTKEVPDATLLELLHPDDAKHVKEAMRSLVDDPKPFSHSMRLRRQDGSYRHFVSHGFPELDDHNEIRSVIGILDDVTDSLNTELALRRTSEQYQMIAEHAYDMFARHSPEGVLTFVSPAVRKVMGAEPEDVVGHNIIEMMHRDDQAEARQKLEALNTGADSVRISFRLPNLKGEFIWLESTVHPILDDRSGEMIEAIAITRDTSERKEYEQRLLDAREKAETANRTKSTFLANMSHELRTPLNAVIGFSEILMRKMYGPLGDDVYDEYANLIHESGTHLLDLINDILDMSKVEAGKMEIKPEPIDLVEIVETCMRFVEAKSEAKTQLVELNVLTPQLHNSAYADIRATKQILINLLSNAVKFTGEGGAISVDVQTMPDVLEVSVSDNGVGIDPTDIPRLLRPFEQIADKSSQAEEGSGLGLALTKSFAELQGGTFRLESEKGQGTRAIVTLPSAHPDLKTGSARA
ncbi:PAS domain S-box protein [Parvibaculaceae bacterium PLY_AMNH_Bact1]|nr:PAS domain S-box protein [Parvibaculaceae bacterium PLY_AMNH_Bact1]